MLELGIAIWVGLYTALVAALGILWERYRWNKLIDQGIIPRPRRK